MKNLSAGLLMTLRHFAYDSETVMKNPTRVLAVTQLWVRRLKCVCVH